MSLATVIVLCLAVLFFGGIIYLDYFGRKEAKPGEPVGLVPREQPAEPSEHSTAPTSSEAAAIQFKSNRKKKHGGKAYHQRRHAHRRAAS